MTDADRTLEFEVEVTGTPEEVWRAIATGPGISSWYVPHTVEEREGGAATASFGPGDGMDVPGRVTVWDPPRRIKFEGDGVDEGLAFEWLVEARDGGSCVVRLVNSGFGSGEDWDAQYDGMAEGWPLFLRNLQLHLEHFGGRSATACLPGRMVPLQRTEAFRILLDGLGVTPDVAAGDRIVVTPSDGLRIAGRVVDLDTHRMAVILDEPVPGTAFLAAERAGDQTVLSVWSYLYDDAGAAAAARDEPRWQAWLDGLAGPESATS